MLRRTYQIQMRTPLGNRDGTLEVQIENDTVRGSLHVLKHWEPLEGWIDEDGYCRIHGRIITLMNTIPYTATGRMTLDSVDLALKGGQNRFAVTGTICREE